MARWLLILCLCISRGLTLSRTAYAIRVDDCQEHNFGKLQRTMRQGFTLLKRAITSQEAGSERGEVNTAVEALREEHQNLREVVTTLREALASTTTQTETQENASHEVSALRRRLLTLKTSLAKISEERKAQRQAHRALVEQLRQQISAMNETRGANTCECPSTASEQESEEESREFYVNDNCTISVMHQGVLRSYEGTSAPYVTFSELESRGCVVLNQTYRNWTDSREACRSMGGDLFVAGDLEGALEYSRRVAPGRAAWVGAREWKWLDGRPVSADEWYPEHPTGDERECHFIYKDNFNRAGLRDTPCLNNRFVLCQKSVSYP